MDPSDPPTDFRAFYPYTPNEVKHRKRTTSTQLRALENVFKRDTKPNAALRNQLAEQLKMTPRGVQVWFQNRRAKEKLKATKAAAAKVAGEPAKLEKSDSPYSTLLPNDLPSPGQSSNPDDAVEVLTPCDQHQASVEQELESAVNDSESSASQQQPPSSSPPVITPPQLRLFTDANLSQWHHQHQQQQQQQQITPQLDTGLAESTSNISCRPEGFSAAERYAQRRGSLPVHGNLPRQIGPAPPMNTAALHRRASVDASLHRLTSNPYAMLAKAKNDAMTDLRPPRITSARAAQINRMSSSYQQQHRPGIHPGSFMSQYANLRRGSMDSRAVLAQRNTASSMPFSAYQTSRASLPISDNLYAYSTRTLHPLTPGPLPSPDFQFGAASSTPAMASPSSGDSERNSPDSPQSFTFRPDEPDDDDYASVGSYGPVSRFGSIVSVATSDTSSCYEFPSPNPTMPSTTMLNTRRNSCTPVIRLMSNLDVSGMPHGTIQEPIIEGSYPHEEVHVTSNEYIDAGPPVNTDFGYVSPASTISTGNAVCVQEVNVPISRSSELAFALENKSEQTVLQGTESHMMYNSRGAQQAASTDCGTDVTQQEGPFYYGEVTSMSSSVPSTAIPEYEGSTSATSEPSYTASYTGDYLLASHTNQGLQTPVTYTNCGEMADLYASYNSDPAIDPTAVFAAAETTYG
ncbi:hypothetical protein AMATHDRAFT_3515 [Amanita thiersii Skay4041]|uniref:Homeobox domain-containing protein n=1 Tax=Amanita thiersii Skay4041 TaxID=703135 RepID=A0A2A9NT70_9AGAR|nr:hypothetical protein AMATHDRAFT_3515 [Amanita thiersii Skay4041]